MTKYFTSLIVVIALSLTFGSFANAALLPFTILQGGTGTSTAPTYGQLLVGNSSGKYDLIATSTLGLPTFGYPFPNNATSTQLTFNGGATTTNFSVTGFADFLGISNPASPPAGTARLHALTTQGFTRFEQDNEAATNITLGRDNVFLARNTSGSPIAHGSAVYVTGSTGNVPNIGLAKADSLTTLPAVGIALDDIADNAFGQVMKLGIHGSHDTSAFTAGDQIYVSTSTAGALINIRPVYPYYVQRMGSILVSGVGNGSYLITTAPFIGGVESGTTQSFSVGGDLDVAGTATSTFNGNAWIKGNLQVDGKFFAPVTLVSSGDATINGALTVTGNIDGTTADFSSTLTMSGTAANIALGSNWLSGDGGDEGVFVGSTGNVGIGTTAPGTILDIEQDVSAGDAQITLRNLNATAGSRAVLSLDAESASGTNYPVKFINGFGTLGAEFTINMRSTSGGVAYYDRFHIDDSGNVGIGTTGPLTTLHVNSNGVFDLSSTNTGQDSIYISNNQAGGGIGNVAGSIVFGETVAETLRHAGIAAVQTTADNNQIGLAFYTHPSATSADPMVEKIRIDHSGNVGIGTTSPAGKLAVSGGGSFGADYNFAPPTNGLIIQGNVGIGTTNPGALLDVAGVMRISGDINQITSGTYGSITSIAYNDVVWAGPRIGFTRGRGTISSKEAVQDGDTVGWFDFFGYDSPTSNVRAGQFVMKVDGAVSSGIVPGKFIISTADSSGTNTARLTAYANDNIIMATNGGNVGIGTTTPGANLHVVSTSGANQFRAQRSGDTTYMDFGVGADLSVFNVVNPTSGYGYAFKVGGDTKVSIDNSGNVGIGTTTPQWLLNPYSATAAQLSLSAGAGVSQWAFRNAGGNLYVAPTTVAGTATSTTALTILNSGNVGIGTTSPLSTLSIKADGTLAIPYATNPSITRVGELGVNTATSSLRFHDGTAERSLYPVQYKSFTVASSTWLNAKGATASSTIPLGVASVHGETWTEITCYTDSAGTAQAEFGDGTVFMDYQLLTTTATTDSSLSNNTFTRYEKRYIRIGQTATNPDYITCSVGIREEAD